MGIKNKFAKRCNYCDKVLREWNKSGLCAYHYRQENKSFIKIRRQFEVRLERQKEREELLQYA